MIHWHHLPILMIGALAGYVICAILSACADWRDDEGLNKWTKGPQ